MNFIAWIVFGALAGWIASIIMGKNAQMGCFANIFVGIVGAVIGGFLAATFLHMPDAVNGINVTSIIVAFVGAVILVGVLRLISPGRRRVF